jgi:nucleoside-diphosphate-sugar epimerase
MIIVTGGSGKLGRVAVRHLMDHGYTVVSLDLAAPPGIANPPRPTDPTFSRVDITDFGQVLGALSGINDRIEEPVTGIVHLGAIAAPGQAMDNVIFETNMMSTYAIFEAARRLKIRNVVWASSETVYGIPYTGGPAYVPVDEAIEQPHSSYALSKLLGEKMAEQYARWDPRTKIVGLRFSNVQEPQDYLNFPGYQDDANMRRFNLWTYIDARDAAQAIRLALESKLKGAHVFGIANSNSLMGRSNEALLDEVYPGTRRKRKLLPNESLISIEKAQRVLGYKPQYDWSPGKGRPAERTKATKGSRGSKPARPPVKIKLPRNIKPG